uniref:(northern house mosquito) hypothetical protein n=1 Tax=Culex pipiens TaxID=7175 RepID=A0A8D8I043_CULPI
MPRLERAGTEHHCDGPRPEPIRPLHHHLGHRAGRAKPDVYSSADWPVGNGALDLLGSDLPAGYDCRDEPQVHQEYGFQAKPRHGHGGQRAHRQRAVHRSERTLPGQLRGQRDQPVGPALAGQGHQSNSDAEEHHPPIVVSDSVVGPHNAAA